MNKFAIPAILVATVMVAGMFAFAPVEQASTVHTSGTVTLAASQGTLVAIDIVDQVFDDGTAGDIIFTLIDADDFPAGQHYTASFVISLDDDIETGGNGDAATVEVQVWDGDQWVNVQANVPTPANGAQESTSIEVAGEITGANGSLRFLVDEGVSDTEATLDVQGIIEIR